MSAIHYIFAAVGIAVFITLTGLLIVRLTKLSIIEFSENKEAPECTEDDLKEYFFLYADNKWFPYRAGWTRVMAPDFNIAEAVFNAFHPGTVDGLTNCATVCEGELFRKTNIFTTGNYGEYEHETIVASRMTIVRKEEENEKQHHIHRH